MSVPAITGNPSNSTIVGGATTTFTATASGSPTPTVQWQVSSNGGSSFSNLANAGVYSGVTTGTLTITGATANLTNNQYQAVFTNINGNATTTAATILVFPQIPNKSGVQPIAVGAIGANLVVTCPDMNHFISVIGYRLSGPVANVVTWGTQSITGVSPPVVPIDGPHWLPSAGLPMVVPECEGEPVFQCPSGANLILSLVDASVATGGVTYTLRQTN